MHIECRLLADFVEKVLSCEESIFFRGAGLMEKLCEGPHVHADFQPARFVARLQGILLPNIGRDGSVANFCFNSIFEFFNRIGQSRQGGDSCRFSNVRNAPLATVGPKKAACRDGP
jgi:hypothetical protein